MSSKQIQVLEADGTTQCLPRGSADYWIAYIRAGEAEFMIGAHRCCAAPDQTVIIAMGNQDVQIKPSENFKANMIGIDDFSSSELMRHYCLLMDFSNEVLNVITVGKEAKNIETVFRNMQMIDDNDEITQRCLLEELMIRLFRTNSKMQAGACASRTELVSNICQRLEKEYNKDLSLAEIAKEYGISISYLAHLFKNTTGVPIMRYLLNCRITAAKSLLTQTVTPIKEITEKCGFKDSSNFGRTFKNETGYSPKQYRQQYSSTED